MTRQKQWNIFEAAILLDNYLKYLIGKLTRKEAIYKTSSELRKLAINNGDKIDEIYRNTNGITFQMYSIESAYKGFTLIKPASKLFEEIVYLYKYDNVSFSIVLKEARSMIDTNVNKKKFNDWLSNKKTYTQISELYTLYEIINKFCVDKNILKGSLLETTDIEKLKYIQNEINHNRIFIFNNRSKMKKISDAMKCYISYVQESSIIRERESVELDESYIKENYVDIKKELNDISLDEKNNNIIINTAEKIERVDFYNIIDYSNTKPLKAFYFEEDLGKIYSWKELYIKVFKNIYEDYDYKIPQNKPFILDNERIDFSTQNYKSMMIEPKEIEKGYYLETSLREIDIIRNIKVLMDICLIDYENIVIEFVCKTDEQYKNQVELESVSKDSINKENICNDVSNRQNEYYKNIGMIENDDIDLKLLSNLLLEKFKNGYRLKSTIDLKRLKEYWHEKYGYIINIKEEKILKYIKKSGLEYKGKIYMAEKLLDEKTKNKILLFINNCFSEGKSIIYFDVLFSKFSDELLYSRIYDKDMLRMYLDYMNNGNYYIYNDFISQYKDLKVNSYDEIKKCLIQQTKPIKHSELFSALPHISEQEIKNILRKHDEFISNGRGESFHIDIVDLNEKDLEDIKEIIKYFIDEKQFISGNELIENINKKYPYIMEKNITISENGLRNAIRYKLREQYSFKGNIISSLGKELSMNEVFINFCKNKDSFTLDELKKLKQELNTIIYFEAVYDNSLRISKNDFVSKSYAAFKKVETDNIINRFCKSEYIAIKRIEQFGLFPDAVFSWNSFLLEHYVANYSPNYKLIHSNYNENICVGGIVKKTSKIDTMDDLIVDVLAKNGLPLQKEIALQYLCEEGYLARKSYSGIENILIKAKELRNKKGI